MLLDAPPAPNGTEAGADAQLEISLGTCNSTGRSPPSVRGLILGPSSPSKSAIEEAFRLPLPSIGVSNSIGRSPCLDQLSVGSTKGCSDGAGNELEKLVLGVIEDCSLASCTWVSGTLFGPVDAAGVAVATVDRAVGTAAAGVRPTRFFFFATRMLTFSGPLLAAPNPFAC